MNVIKLNYYLNGSSSLNSADVEGNTFVPSLIKFYLCLHTIDYINYYCALIRVPRHYFMKECTSLMPYLLLFGEIFSSPETFKNSNSCWLFDPKKFDPKPGDVT